MCILAGNQLYELLTHRRGWWWWGPKKTIAIFTYRVFHKKVCTVLSYRTWLKGNWPDLTQSSLCLPRDPSRHTWPVKTAQPWYTPIVMTFPVASFESVIVNSHLEGPATDHTEYDHHLVASSHGRQQPPLGGRREAPVAGVLFADLQGG